MLLRFRKKKKTKSRSNKLLRSAADVFVNVNRYFSLPYKTVATMVALFYFDTMPKC